MKYEIITVTPQELDARIAPLLERIEYLEGMLVIDDPVPPSNVYYFSTSSELKNWLSNQKEGDTVELASMNFNFPLEIKASNITIRAAEGAKVKCVAWVQLKAAPDLKDGIYRIPYTHGLYKHPATQEGPWDGHRDRMCPHQFVANGKLLTPVYSKTALKPGTSFLEGPSDKPKAVHVIAHDNEPLEALHYAKYARLLTASSDVKNVTIEGIEFEGAASTGKRGAVKTGDGWNLGRCRVSYSAGPGFEVTGEGVWVQDCTSEHNGQLNYLVHHYNDLTFWNNVSKGGNRKGFNAAWEAGGTKIVNDWKNPGISANIQVYESYNDNGPGLWFDINNKIAVVKGVIVRNALAAGVMFEHGFYNGEAKDITVEGIRPYNVPAQSNTRQDGIVWQSQVWDSEFRSLSASGCKNGGVYKKHEGRGASGRNTIDSFETSNVSNPLYIERMIDSEIRAAIAKGAGPDSVEKWHQPDTITNID